MDLNPEIFASLPLSEFIRAADEFYRIEEENRQAGWTLQKHRELHSGLQTSMERREMWHSEFLSGFISDVYYVFAYISSYQNIASADLKEEINKKFEHDGGKIREITDDNFDLSPRQIIEEYIKILDGYLPFATSYAELAKKERQAFLEKYGITEDTQEVPSLKFPFELQLY